MFQRFLHYQFDWGKYLGKYAEVCIEDRSGLNNKPDELSTLYCINQTKIVLSGFLKKNLRCSTTLKYVKNVHVWATIDLSMEK